MPGVAAVLGCSALVVRSVSYASMLPTALVGLVGLVAPLPRPAHRAAARPWLAVVAVGSGAFLFVRMLAPAIGPRLTALGIASIVLAALAEEAFFRRFVYGILEVRGAGVAIAVSAALFAIVHVPQYGVGVLAIDLAAGLLLGWQRNASGTWTAPAATHVVANLLQLG